MSSSIQYIHMRESVKNKNAIFFCIIVFRPLGNILLLCLLLRLFMRNKCLYSFSVLKQMYSLNISWIIALNSFLGFRITSPHMWTNNYATIFPHFTIFRSLENINHCLNYLQYHNSSTFGNNKKLQEKLQFIL